MSGASLDLLELAVVYLALFTLATVLATYFVLDLRHRRELSRQAKRVILAGRLTGPLDFEGLTDLWSKCARASRRILEEILVDRCRLAEGEERRIAGEFLISAGVREQWIQGLRHGGKNRRVDAARKLGFVRDPRSVEVLVAASGDRTGEVQLAVALSLGRLRDPKGIPALTRLAEEPSYNIPDLTLAAALAGCAEGSPDLLAPLLGAPEPRTRVIGAWALSEVAGITSLPALSAAVHDPDPEVRAKVARALARVPGEASLDLLRVLVRDSVPFVRLRALDALGKSGLPAAAPDVVAGLEDHMPEVRYRAAAALRELHGMKAEVVSKVVATGSRRGFKTLMAEWQRAGFLLILVAGLSTRYRAYFAESREVIRTLIAVGMTQALVNMVSVYPDIKVRLRLLRLLLAAPDANIRTALAAVAERPDCDSRVARAVRRAAVARPDSPNQNGERRLP